MQLVPAGDAAAGVPELAGPALQLLQSQHDGHQWECHSQYYCEQGSAALPGGDCQLAQMSVEGGPQEETHPQLDIR